MAEQVAEPPAAALTEDQKPPPAAPPAQEATPPRAPVLMGSRGLVFTSLPDMWRFAQYVHEADWGPKNSTPESNLVAIQFGAELGVPAMQAIQNIAPINGRPCAYGDLPLGLCMRSPYFDHLEFKEWFSGTPYNDDFTANCRARRLGGNFVEATFSIADAKRAGLWEGAHSVGKFQKKEDTTWYKYFKRMLKYRARGYCLRDTFADVLMGLHTEEEMSDVDEMMARLDLGERSTPVATESTANLREQLTDPAKVAAKAKKGAKTKQPEPAAPASEPPPEDDPALMRTAIKRNLAKVPKSAHIRILKTLAIIGCDVIGEIKDTEKLREINDALIDEIPASAQ